MSFVTPKREMNTGNEDQIAVMGDQQVQVQSREEEKMPLFLIKLWNIVEDPAYQQIVHWDETGYSFHIVDPYSFCRNVLPHYFKHNNLNSLIRQLNMYGFRKMTPLDRSGLTRAESDQDHLEFSHPYFVRDHPELLVNIKRKSSNRNDTSGSQSNLTTVTEELRTLRERQRNMDVKMSQLVKENESMWEQISMMRAQHHKQQQVVSKLVQFLVALVQPQQQKQRIPKRGLLALDEPPAKRARNASTSQFNQQSNALSDALDNLQRHLSEGGGILRNRGGPIIADITEEVPPNLIPNSQPLSPNEQNWSSMVVPPYTGDLSMNDLPGPATPINTAPVVPDIASSSLNATLSLSPSIDRQLSAELQEYLSGIDVGIDNCRDLLGNQWDIGEYLMDGWNDDNEETQNGRATGGHQLALEGGVNQDVYPNTPTLLTPSSSPHPQSH